MIKTNSELLKKVASITKIYLGLLLTSLLYPLKSLADDSDDIFGTIKPPPGVDKYQQQGAGDNYIGIFAFINTIVRLITIGAGIWVMFNFIMAGWIYITSDGSSEAGGKVASKMTYSVVGLVIVVLAYSIAALVGLIVFGEADFFLNPELQTIDNI